ncbi:hypothetical protein JIN84_21135 [Luteolibacter yonseiensis]|uniref:Uncharacterized protein n=1 Tax=Luteolibacter yonseiensis TaxID=1144680 RepID=A0A934R6G4_9BACT|nr:hypothetical protein [Luteolibacter yonseiensis]MBK1818141.1 hypothetical protein [Luteolibacter yonseiensis]
MKPKFLFLATLLIGASYAFAEVSIDEEAFGKSLGGWKRKGTAAEYPLSGADYRTYKPETSPTPDGGIFISVRIDHVRGWLATNDHANLEMTVNSKGAISSAQSTLAIQGQSIKSDVILGGNEAGKAILSPEGAVQIGTDLVANLTAKLLRENIVEAGRVSFPAVLRHNYNRLFQAIRVDGFQILPNVPTATVVPDTSNPDPAAATTTQTQSVPPAPATPPTPPPVPATPPPAPASPPTPAPEKAKEPEQKPLEIKPYF